MSIQYVDGALRHFLRHLPLLGVASSNDIDECILLATDEGRLRFVDAVLNAVVGEQLNGDSEAVALGGLRAIIDPAATMLSYSIFAEGVPTGLRSSVFIKMHSVFAEVFARRCDPILAHRATSPLSPWNQLCFMWWETLPRHGVPTVPFLVKTDLALLELMGRVLEVDHVACKEAALHGLALWQAGRPDEVRSVIEEHASAIPLVLQEYALAAKAGYLQ